MADKEDILEDDDFEKLLDSFINDTNLEETSDKDAATESYQDSSFHETTKTDDDNNDDEMQEDEMQEDEIDYASVLSPEDQKINSAVTDDLDQELVSSLQDAKAEAEEDKNQPTLGNDESELAQAFLNFFNSVNKLSSAYLNKNFECLFEIDDLYPNYKPSTGRIISDDIVNGWLLLTKMFPKELGNFPINSSDEAFLNFAEKLANSDLQLAVISYVEILIDIESCELSYKDKYLKYQEKHIKKIMYEEYMARKERQKKFTEALAKKNFPVDADRLISNYFRVAQKDVDGAFKALTTNPAIFAPIDFSKIKPRWFGLVKVTPKDGIRINLEIGNFLKRLKV